MKKLWITLAIIAASFAGAALAEAQTWKGEGSASAGVTTGNTETTDVGIGAKLTRETELWRTGIEAFADYGEIDGAESKNRLFFAGQVDRNFSERVYGFGRASYERDEFSGFENRIFAGGGLGYHILMGDVTTWAVEGGPGLKIDKVRDITTPVAVPGSTEESLAWLAASRFAHAFNDNVKLTNDTSVLYAETSTQIGNSLALTAALSSALSARISLDVRHDTDPPLGFEDTDTATRVSLVYAFGAE
jgi:putative salt-induced outer membrane protein